MRLCVSWPLNGDWEDNEDKIMEVVENNGGKPGDSGAGFGMRDYDFKFKSTKMLQNAKLQIEALNIDGIEFTD